MKLQQQTKISRQQSLLSRGCSIVLITVVVGLILAFGGIFTLGRIIEYRYYQENAAQARNVLFNFCFDHLPALSGNCDTWADATINADWEHTYDVIFCNEFTSSADEFSSCLVEEEIDLP
jgi:hypothetical protein